MSVAQQHQHALNKWTDKFLVGIPRLIEDGLVGHATNARIMTVKYYLGYDKRDASWTSILEDQMAHPHTRRYFKTQGGMAKGAARRVKQRATNRRGATAISERGLNAIAGFEGFVDHPYKDAVGVWTIGYGHTAGVGPNSPHLTRVQARALLRKDVNSFARGVTRLLKRRPSQGEFDALVSFAYNVGLGALGSSTLLRKYNAGDRIGAADEFLKWNHAGGRVLAGLTRRREVERTMFLAG